MFNSLIVTSAQMKEIDRQATGGSPIAGYEYMQKAGFGAAKILELKWGPFDGDEVLIVVGKGNNGGDGLEMATQLKSLGAQVEVVLAIHPENFSGEALLAWQNFQESDIAWSLWEGEEIDWQDKDIIVDGILGLGATGEVREFLHPLLNSMQEACDQGVFLFSLDCPTGKLSADATAVFGFTRWESIDPMTAEAFGEVGVVDLDYPEAVLREVVGIKEIPKILDPQWYLPFLPVRDRFGDKRAHGTGLLVAGGENMGGAAILSGLGALRLGLGYLKIACAPSERLLVQGQLIEAPYVSWDLSEGELNQLWDEFDSIAIGPGLGIEASTQERVRNWVRNFPRTMVVDADAINAFKGDSDLLNGTQAARIITPHQAEFERVFGPLPDSLSERVQVVKKVAVQNQLEILLKGPVSILASSRGEICLYNQGSSALARAGSGDVLSGILLALSSRWLAKELAFPTLCLGVWLHGMAAEIAKEELSEISMRSSEIPDYLGAAVESMLKMMTQSDLEYGDALEDEEDF